MRQPLLTAIDIQDVRLNECQYMGDRASQFLHVEVIVDTLLQDDETMDFVMLDLCVIGMEEVIHVLVKCPKTAVQGADHL